jgi:sulfate/thiosulfate transport system ATP-binding protein
MDIRVRDIVKTFEPGNARAALNGVSLDIESGELLALLGPSGSGKTTLLRVIAGLEYADAGQVFFGDMDASRKSVQERKVGFVFQNYALFRNMSVAENIEFGLRVRTRATRPAQAEIRRRALELLDLVQLAGLEARRPAQLSGGQRQRVALARALAVEPKVLLLDEPFGALDAKVRRELRRWLREIHDRTGHTTIFVTHDQDEALELADRVAVLNLGRIEQIGTADAVYDHPATPFVHAFIGEASSVAVEIHDGRAFLGGQHLGLPTASRSGTGRLFVRPQDVVMAESAAGAIEGKIVAVRRTGATRRAEILLPSAQETIEIDAPSAIMFRAGDRIPVRFIRGTIFADNSSAAA